MAIDWLKCKCTTVADISLDTKKKSVSHIAADMSYIYLVVNGELKMVPRDGSDEVYDVEFQEDVQNITGKSLHGG